MVPFLTYHKIDGLQTTSTSTVWEKFQESKEIDEKKKIHES